MATKSFKAQLTPKKMLEFGVFGGWYFGTDIDEYPKYWFKNAKLCKNQFDENLNYFCLIILLEWKVGIYVYDSL